MGFLAKTENNKIRFSKEEEIIKYVLDTINKICPVIDDRLLKTLEYPLSHSKLTIDIEFYKFDKDEFTQIMFVNGSKSYASSTGDDLVIDGVVSKNIVDGIIASLIKDHDVVYGFYNSGPRITIDLGLDYALSLDRGIGCSHIEIIFDFYKYGDYKNLQQSFVNNIVTVFYDKFKDTEYVKRNLNYYITDFKENNIKPMSDLDVLDFMKNFTIDELKDMICSLNNEKFIDVYNRYLENNNEETFIKKLLP